VVEGFGIRGEVRSFTRGGEGKKNSGTDEGKFAGGAPKQGTAIEGVQKEQTGVIVLGGSRTGGNTLTASPAGATVGDLGRQEGTGIKAGRFSKKNQKRSMPLPRETGLW